jgi:hypothetical protein
MEEQIELLANGIASLDTNQIPVMIEKIRKVTKKKPITSGNLSSRQYYRKIAEFCITKPSTHPVLKEFNLVEA